MAHSLALKADGSVVAWGYNYAGQCNVPPPNSNFVAVAGGDMHSLGLKADGSIVAWGSQSNIPAPNTGFVAIAAGVNSLGLKADGSIVSWGPEACLPTPNSGFVAISANFEHCLAIRGYPGDINSDGHVDVVDLLIFVDTFGLTWNDPRFDPACDINNDGSVDVVDLLHFIEDFGKYKDKEQGRQATATPTARTSRSGRYAGNCKIPSPRVRVGLLVGP
jgi:alpha-tubulin suppressor-like RCC1 family protein